MIARNEEKSKTESQKPPHINQQQQQPLQQPLPVQQQPQPQQSQQPLHDQPPQQQMLQSVQDPHQGHQHEQLATPVSIHTVVDNVPVTSVIPVPLTPTTPVRSVTPLTPGTPGALTPTTPTAPTFPLGQVLSHPPIGPGIAATVTNHPPSGKTVSSKGKKSKEEKEREKEMRKQRLRIQQEQERQWKILQQKRALEQQRQQQQQQQENVLLRAELKKQQQAKGVKAGEEQKKKRLPKGSKRSSSQAAKDPEQPIEQAAIPSPSSIGEKSEGSPKSAQTTVQQPVLPVGGASFSTAPRANANALASSSAQYQNETSLELLSQCDGQRNGLLEEREGDQSIVNSNNEILTSTQSARTETNHQYQGTSVWQNDPMEEMAHQSREAWEQLQGHSQLELQKQPNNHNSQAHEVARPNLWGHEDLQPEAIQDCLATDNMQGSTPLLEQHVRPSQECLQAEQAPPGSRSAHEQVVFHGDRQQTWLPRSHPHSSGIPTTQSAIQSQQPSRESGQIIQQPPISDPMQAVPFASQHEVTLNCADKHQQQGVEVQQPSQQIPVMHWQEELSQVRAQVAAAHDLHPAQSVAPPSVPPPPPPPPPLPASQQQQSASLHPYDISTGWPQQGQVPPPHVLPQSMVAFPQQPQKPGIPQMSFQPMQQPPNQIPPNQHSNLPISSQPQENQMIQPQQQQDVAQGQQREQLIRARQQQFFQMLQHQQVLQKQQQQQQQHQQQQTAAIQPGFARARFNPVMNTKDMPEIDTEEEHQERLRFLYRQRQAQKQQQIHAQLMQQAWIQQQLTNGGGQGVMPPAVLPVDISNPQIMQQLAAQQIRPQMPDLTQQQLFTEYQRRLQQRQDLGQQTVQYDKVLHELQQQQGIPGAGGTHAGGPFVEVTQQRFALRQPTPMVQPGLKPIMPLGLDGHFVGQQQQLYKMQLQQQIIMMQQQTNEPPPNDTLQASPASGKIDIVKGNGEVSANSESDGLQKSVSPAQCDAVCDMQGKLNSSVEELTQPCLKPESIVQQPDLKVDSVNRLSSEALTSFPSEDEKVKKEANYKKDHSTGELDAGQESRVTLEGKESTSGQDKDGVNPLDTTAFKEGCDKRQAETTCADDKKRDKDTVEHIAEHQAEEKMIGDIGNEKVSDSAEVISSASNTLSVASRDVECKVGADIVGHCGEEYRVGTETQATKPDTEDALKNTEERNKVKAESDVQNVKLPCKPEEYHDINQVAAQPHHAASQGMPAPPPQLQHFHRDVNLPSKPEAYHEISQVPAQPHHAPTQGPPVPPPQPQHFVISQQLMGLQQQFLQMEQQRQVLVQQYQQLQQQLLQAGGQDPGLASQVVAVQSQGQALQQQMVQVHQQMQLLQQQFAVQQQQQQQQPQVQQWPQQGHLMGVQPGGFPVRPGVMRMQHPLQAALPLPDKVRCFS